MEMVACIIEWGHRQTIDKWSGHPSAEYEYKVKVSEFMMYVGLETLFLGPEDKDSHTILYFTLRHNLTIARDRRRFVPFPTKQDRNRNRRARQEANRRARAKALRRARARSKAKPPKAHSTRRYGNA